MEIRIQFSTDALFGDYDTDGYDIPACVKKFEAILRGALHAGYPEADVEVTHGIIDGQTVNGTRRNASGWMPLLKMCGAPGNG